MESWRSWYTWLIATPAIGRRVLQSEWVARQYMRLNAGLPFPNEEAEIYARSFREPDRAQAVVELYRYYQRVLWQTARGEWRSRRLTRPTVLLFGEGDASLRTRLLPGYEPYTDDMRVETVPDAGHFIVDEKPDLVVDRVREWLTAGSAG